MKKLLLPILVLNLILQSCSSINSTTEKAAVEVETEIVSEVQSSVYNEIPLIGYTNFSPKNLYSLMPRYQNFENKKNPKQSFIIANMISVVQPEMDEESRDEMAVMIAKVSKKFKIAPEIIVSIIDTESNFKASMVSSTGDLSIAQINVDVWNKEFSRLGLPIISKEKVVSDLEYSLHFMAEILSVLKTRYAKTDPNWFARYHSSTPKFKNNYFKKLTFRLDLIARSENLRNQIAQIENIKILSPAFSNEIEARHSSNNMLFSMLSLEPMSTPEYFTPKEETIVDSIEYATNLIFDIIRL
jgi:hypothetical protein